MIQGVDFIGEGNARANKVINGYHKMCSAHVLAHFLLFIDE